MCKQILSRKWRFTPAARHTQSCCKSRAKCRWYDAQPSIHSRLIMASAKTSESASSHCLYLLSWWVEAVLRPGRWTSRSGCGQAGPSGSRSVRTPCRAQCGFRRPGCAPAAPSTAAPARRNRTSADAPRTRLTGRHRNFITNHFLNLLEFVSGVNLGMRSL